MIKILKKKEKEDISWIESKKCVSLTVLILFYFVYGAQNKNKK